MPAVARLGNTSTHGGQIITASPNVKANGIAVARLGDTFDCPTHGPNPIMSNPVTRNRANGSPIAVVGAQTQCGAVIIAGSPNVNSN